MSSYTGFVIESNQPATNHTEDESAVRHLFQQLMAAWAAGDADAYGALFTEDADYIAFDGVNAKGRAAIVASHKPLFERFLKGSYLTGDLVSLRKLAPNVILAHAVGSIVDPGRSTPKPERLSSQTLIAVQEQDEWRFRAFHNTRVRPIARGLGGLAAWVLADLFWRLLGPKPKAGEE
ncbi:MAG: SgcJ/EcaC family oxidoreductase [Caldilinea sp. CFX5]|nr:SgcJ/EcaC family oxidoreductase [Caldilinea sp. CFX5]